MKSESWRMMRSRLAVYVVVMSIAATVASVFWPMLGRSALAQAGLSPSVGRAAAARQRVLPVLEKRLSAQGLAVGDEVFIRILKQEAELELWMRPKARQRFVLSHRYPICTFSGQLGPKTRQGDGQAPEGFYSVRRGQLNPASSYHLSFNLGYPNAYERAQGWTGDYLMVHGNCVSIGCYAMGDAAIEEIYTLVEAALIGGQTAVSVHAFPFRLDAAHEAQRIESPHAGFWAQLAAGYRSFEAQQVPPRVSVRDGRYRID
jgi:murein L,D-transpeptidase YafK